MPVSVKMPALGESVTEGTITRWLKQEGEQVEADEPLLEISTDKVDTEIPAPAAGVLSRILVAEDEVVEVGAELATIADHGEATSSQPAAPPAIEPSPAPAAKSADEPAPRPEGQESATADTEVVLPPLGEGVTEGTITRWLKQEGEQVEADEPLLEISTDKVDTEIPAPAAGTLREIRTGEDETVVIGTVLAVIGSAADLVPAAQPAPTPAEPTAPPVQEKIYATPLVRKLATEHDIDLATVTGSGVGGRIRKQDVLDAVAARENAQAAAPPPKPEPDQKKAKPVERPAPSPLRGRTEKLSRTRALIARRMVESLQTSAQLTTVIEVDVTKIAKLRAQAKDRFQATHGVKLSFLPFFALATVEALRVHPRLNATIDQAAGTVTYFDAEHLGVAVDTERGLLVPVISNAGDLSLAGLARRIADVAERTRSNQVSPAELSGGTFTLTNTGSRGTLLDTPIINQPQVGILGTGAVVRRVAVMDDPELGEITMPRSMAFLSLTYDHRLVDGADAARFLATIKDRLETGDFAAELALS